MGFVSFAWGEWQAWNTPSVRLLAPEGSESLVATTLLFAEEALHDISQRLGVSLAEPPTWVLFPSFRTLERSHIPPDDLSEGLRPWTPLLRHRTVLVFEGSFSRLRADVRHAMTHAIQAQMLYPSVFSGKFWRYPPDWFLEGMALYFAGTPEAQDEIILRGASLDNRLLTLEELSDFRRVDDLPLAYMEGFSAVSYLAETYGEAVLGELFRALVQGKNMDDALEGALDLTIKMLNKQWQRAVKKRYWPLVRTKTSPDSLATALPAGRGEDISDLAWSPSSEVLACLARTFRRDEIRLISAKDGTTLRVLAAFGLNESETLERRGRALAWSPDGDFLLFVTYGEKQTFLNLLDIITQERVQRWELPFEEAFSPTFFPDGKRVLLVGLLRGRTDLYAVDLETGRLTQITNDDAFDAEPSIHPSGTRVLYVSERNAATRLVEWELATGEYRVLFDGAPGIRMPFWSPGGEGFLFTADWNGTRDVYSAKADETRLIRLTNLLVGAETPALSPDGKKLAFSAQRQSRENAFVLPLAEANVENVTPPSPSAEESQLQTPTFFPGSSLPRELLWENVGFRLYTGADGFLRGAMDSLFASWTGDTRVRLDLEAVPRGTPNLTASLENLRKQGDLRLKGTLQTRFHRSPGDFLVGERTTALAVEFSHHLGRATRVSATATYSRSPLRYRFEGLPANLDLDHPHNMGSVEIGFIRENTLVIPSAGSLTGTRVLLTLDQTFGEGIGATTFLFDGRRYFRLGFRTVLATRLYSAVSFGPTPQRLTLGGHTTLRASEFEERTGSRIGFASLELRVPLMDELRLGWPLRWRIASIQGVVFLESGTAWSKGRSYRLSERVRGRRRLVDLSLQYGFGFRVRAKGIPVRLDLAREDRLDSVGEWRTVLRLDENF